MDSLLNDLLKNGILDETVICKLKAMKDQEYLNMHRYKIYQNKDGRWVTYLPGRKRIQRKDRAELEDLVIEYYKKNRYDPTIIDIFKELHAQGNTIVLITHDNDVAKQAHRSIRILDGQITEVTL